jgi:hypothetical protein
MLVIIKRKSRKTKKISRIENLNKEKIRLEKKYYMKKDSEDIYIIEFENDTLKKVKFYCSFARTRISTNANSPIKQHKSVSFF